MASSTLVKDVLYRASSQLLDIMPQFTRWTERELVSWLNDGQKSIAKYMPSSCSRVDAIKLSPGTKQSIESILASNIIPGDGSVPAAVYGNYLLSVQRNMGSNGLTPGRAIRIGDREVLDVNNPTWHTDTGEYVSQYMFDPRFPKVFYVSPGIKSTGTYWVEVSYLADPTEVAVPTNPTLGTFLANGTSTVSITIDDRYVDDLVNYILARAYMKDAEYAANPQLAAAHSSMFTSSINAQVAALTGVNPNLQSLPMSPSVPAARG